MKALVVIDMQKDFIDGSLGTAEAVAIVPAVAEKIRARKAEGWQIIFTRDTHSEEYMETNEGKHLPVVHCIEETPGWEINGTLDTTGALIVNKPSFGFTGWADVMEDMLGGDLEEIELVGLCTDICVVSNALILKALYPEIRISVDPACCAGVTPATHEAALTTMKMCQIEIEE
ncbi:MAG: cysteine hydrolase [Lachnospiraceae bacterium]|nr:cysteine hydrolase [Lachnospiraceae bacterium]